MVCFNDSFCAVCTSELPSEHAKLLVDWIGLVGGLDCEDGVSAGVLDSVSCVVFVEDVVDCGQYCCLGNAGEEANEIIVVELQGVELVVL